ncbi:type I-E CRISPR-associated protein Cse2/CasB [Streptomyces griseorubiginosus]|uniref:Type I-E CRISPR-associated protein Cse2/CasB n=1 Tax=Streptomyces griseorubiginosus TaxID=67304 RepID=A0A117QWT7_9ACTN|nr:type I-E CRISPR-associated protein Cse2/CasB [Streptomyces griseorubiginosus]KUN58408.1 type I-E CRISPR-associated protein Cse2/CasB [Streptomyces griseorubiginosus]
MMTATDPPTVRARVAELAAARITTWQEGYLRDRPKDVAALARLRRGAGRDAGQLPDLWTLVDTTALHARLDGVRPLREEELVRAEDALHVALTLWALHQQSRPTRMHRPHTARRPAGLGAAVRRLMPPDGIDEPIRKRLVRAGLAADLTSLSQRLRDLVVLLRRADIPLDYGLLAGQLYAWQWPAGADRVRREWGRSFHARQEHEHPAPGNNATTANDTVSSPDRDKDAS